MLAPSTSIGFYCCVTNYHQPEGNGKPLQYCCLENPMEKEPCGLQSMGWQRVRYNLATKQRQMWLTTILIYQLTVP